MSLFTNTWPIPLEGKKVHAEAHEAAQEHLCLLQSAADDGGDQADVRKDRRSEKKGLMNMPEFFKVLNDFKVLKDPQREDTKRCMP